MLFKKFILTFYCLAAAACLFAQEPQDFVIPVKVWVNDGQPSITLQWPANKGAADYTIKRKVVSEDSYNKVFDLIATLTAGADTVTTFTDNDITPGLLYEYEVSGNFPSLLPAIRNNYLCAGVNISQAYNRGTIILVCDNTITAALETELRRLYMDLVGDGWKVKRIDVNRSSNPADAPGVRNKIIEAYNQNPGTKEVFIIGHVPIPYSGALNPDGHINHFGAWPADGYYGDMVNNNWTDEANITYYPSTRPENRNVPFDGKFDQNNFTSVQLGVGRVDFSNMPSFSISEIDLLKRYLNKNHQFRTGTIQIQKKALIEDNFLSYAEKFSQAPWKSFTATVGFDNISNSQYETGLFSPSGYLWSYGAGAGTYSTCSGIGATTDFANGNHKTIFTQLFGSLFGDWDSEDNLMRASIAGPGNTLACVWGGRPHWYFHHMAAGYPLGYTVLLTMNNKSVYYNTGNNNAKVHIGLMGDPSLRSDYIQPITGLTITVNKTAVDISWNKAAYSGVNGFNIYRSNSITNDFVQLNDTLVTGTGFSDWAPLAGKNVYMVRAVKKDTFLTSGIYSNSSSYINLSQGIIDSLLFSNIVLPVTLESFNARLNNCTAELTWKTSIEEGIKEYVIEYSINGINFIPVGKNATSGVLKTHLFVHTPLAEKAFYRLKIVSNDGGFEYSKTLALQINCLYPASIIYPNPVTDILNVNVTMPSNTSTASAMLSDASGKILYQGKIINGSNSINMKHFSQGIYHLKLTVDYTTRNYKIHKQHF